MSTRVDIEELQTTKTEKLLAVVLAVFLGLGLVWTYQKADDWVRADGVAAEAPSTPAIERRNEAQRRVAAAQQRVAAARDELELRREAYRTALDADRPARDLEEAYLQSVRDYERAQRERAAAQQALRAAIPAARADEQRLFREADDRRRTEERNIFFARLLLTLLAMALAYLVLWHLHGRQSRYVPLAFAAVAASTALAYVTAGDYMTDYINPLDLGPLLLSVTGSAAAITAFYLLQRYLVRRLPTRRVRKEQCPFCGYPVRGNSRCEGCGRDVVAACAKCGSDRRVGTLHCGACGAM